MKKFLLTLTLYAATLMCAHAGWGLKLTLADGNEPCYVLAEKPVVTFDGDNMIITSPEATAQYARAEIVNMTFIEDVASVEDVTDATSVLSYVGGVVTAPDADITVYDLTGTVCLTGHGSLSLEGLAKGIYIVSTPKQTLKVIR